MIITLKCKKCSEIQAVKFEDILQEEYYKCVNCRNIMSMRDSAKFSNLLTLDSFDIITIREGNANTIHKNDIFSRDLAQIQKIYDDSTNEIQNIILGIIDEVYLILNRNKEKDTNALHNSVRQFFIDSIEDDGDIL